MYETNISIDLETMSTQPNAAITAIGAVVFYPKTGETGDKFYVNVNLESAVAAGGVMDPATVLWWMQQSDAARAMYLQPGTDISSALRQFGFFVRTHASEDSALLWGNGAAADNVWLASAFRNSKLPRPWTFRGDRCYRTKIAENPEVDVPRVGTAHNALDDAVYQARRLMAVLDFQRANRIVSA